MPPAPAWFSTTKGLAEALLQDIAEQPRRDIGRTAGTEGNDDPDRPRRVALRR
jgi:hypothetical protein